jgi:outer membrane protein TolC
MKKTLILIIILSLSAFISAETLDIHQAISIGLKNSYDVNSQTYSLDIAKQNLFSSFLDFVPEANYNISQTENKNNIEKSGNIAISESFSSNDYRYFRIKSNLSSLKKRKIDLQLTRRELVYQIIQYYLNVLQNKKLLEVSEQGIEIARRNLEETKIFFSYGKVSDLDLQTAEISLSRAQIDSLKAKNSLEKSKMDLCFLINIKYKKDYEFAEFDYEFLKPSDFTFSEEENLKIASLKENWDQARINYSQNKMNFLPTLSFSLNKNLNWKEENLLGFDRSASPLKYTLSLSYPLFKPLTNLPTNKSSKYQLKQSLLQFDRTKKEQRQNFDFLLTRFQQSQEGLKLGEKQEELERTHFNLVNEKYKLGQTNLTELENARKDLLQSTTEKIKEYYNLILIQEELNLVSNAKILKRY